MYLHTETHGCAVLPSGLHNQKLVYLDHSLALRILLAREWSVGSSCARFEFACYVRVIFKMKILYLHSIDVYDDILNAKNDQVVILIQYGHHFVVGGERKRFHLTVVNIR